MARRHQRDAGPGPFCALAGCVARCGSTAAPLVAAWRRCHIRGDCKARQMIQLGAVIGCGSTAWVRRLAVNPSVGVRRQLPLHKGAVFAFLHRACPARQRSMGAAARRQSLSRPSPTAPLCTREPSLLPCTGSTFVLLLSAAAQYGSPGTGRGRRGRFPESPGWWDLPGRADPAGPGRTSRKYPKTRSCLPETAPPPLRWPH